METMLFLAQSDPGDAVSTLFFGLCVVAFFIAWFSITVGVNRKLRELVAVQQATVALQQRMVAHLDYLERAKEWEQRQQRPIVAEAEKGPR